MAIDGSGRRSKRRRIAKCTRDEGASMPFRLAQSKRMPPAKSRVKDRLFCPESAGFRDCARGALALARRLPRAIASNQRRRPRTAPTVHQKNARHALLRRRTSLSRPSRAETLVPLRPCRFLFAVGERSWRLFGRRRARAGPHACGRWPVLRARPRPSLLAVHAPGRMTPTCSFGPAAFWSYP
jgi:hypothetical protein